jgi:hypothetical protein
VSETPRDEDAELAEDCATPSLQMPGRARVGRLAPPSVDLLPDQTGDDRAEGWGDRSGGRADEDYLRERPPHHGD